MTSKPNGTFGSGRVVGVMTRSHLDEDTLGREGPDARVAQVISVMLPTILDDNLSAEVTDVGANACVVVQAEGRLVGIYEPDGRDLPA